MENIAVTLEGVVHKFGSTTALNNVNLKVERGKLFGLIGPDGAGKSSLIRILASVAKHQQGTVEVLGFKLPQQYQELRKHVGYLTGRFTLYPDLSVSENISLFAGLYGHKPDAFKDNFKSVFKQLEPFGDRPAGKLSGGMKQKLALSCALSHNPSLLLLDEPTTGVDPVARFDFWQTLTELKQTGLTTIVATPYLTDADSCDEIAVMSQGQALFIGQPLTFKQTLSKPVFKFTSENIYHLLNEVRSQPNTEAAYLSGLSVHYIDKRPDADEADMNNILSRVTVHNARFERVAPSYEDCYLNLVRHAQ